MSEQPKVITAGIDVQRDGLACLVEVRAPSRIPSSYRPATWRGTLPCDAGETAVSFNLGDGSVLRLRLPVDSALHLAESLADYLVEAGYAVRTNSQSRSSSGSPSVDGSMPDEGQ